ncbi:CLIP-associated protein [Corchorus capsularis]|uniref:CLIP-associated protein n=1 Tax=Corchorus capsularis TaxID=210143 RepID=A0A1R3JWZ1_COCAP|nr:CLIP-associated protein [Corchorus capsularis]
MEKPLELARSKDPKDRATGAELLHSLLQSSTRPLSSSEVASVVSTCLDLLNDPSNLKASLRALQCLASTAVLSPDYLKLHFDGVLPAVAECLGDDKQALRDAARGLLLTFMEVSSPTIIVDKAGPFTWMHDSWRVREEFLRIVTSAITVFASTEFMRAIFPHILKMLSDSTQSIREAAILCIEEMYMQFGPKFHAELQRHKLPSSVIADINIRLKQIEPNVSSIDGLVCSTSPYEVDLVKVNQAESSPKKKRSIKDISVSGGEIDVTDKPVVPVTLHSEKELIREMEKIASMLIVENDWSVRIAAMQQVEALVVGGAVDYPSFHALLKQLVAPLCTQLSDRRSSIVKQACHLLSFLSKELLSDFEACAEMFIPVLFKLVVITINVIAESADTCIKTMLRNCKVSHVLPQIVDHAKHDRSAVLRARCCEYSLLMLEYWADAPEIQRSADLYEDLIKCCVADAVSEVRSHARRCYRMFKKSWPERSQQLFLSFDSAIQRMINDEDGGIQRRHPSPSIRGRELRKSNKAFHAPTSTNLPGVGTSLLTTMDRSRPVPVGTSLSSGPFPSEVKSLGNGTERSFESVQHANKQRVPAIQNMLAGLDISEKLNFQKKQSASLDLGVDPPARGLPFPHTVTTSAVATNAIFTDSTASTVKAFSSSNAGKQAFDKLGVGLMEEHSDERFARKSGNKHIDRQYIDISSKDNSLRDSQGNNIPNFQRPLSRKNVSGRASGNSRGFLDDNQILLGEMSNCVDGPASLQEALTEGLSPSSNWSARVAAFNYVRSLLQQDQKGIQEVIQNFEKVMKLFFQHLDDPRHKVAHAALSALADIIAACRKPFESYLDRILHHVFSRLIDPKELVRKLSLMNLEVVSKAYGIDSLLPALLRALDEQRSPKVKLAVIEYAIASFKKNPMNSEGAANSGILKLWLAKLIPLIYDKNTKLKDAAISCIISVHTDYDSTGVLNYIMCLSVEEQNSVRRVLRQQTPRIEMDLMNFLQNKREKPQTRNVYEQSDVGLSPDGEYTGAFKKANYFGRYSSGSGDVDNSKKSFSTQDQEPVQIPISQKVSSEAHEYLHQNLEGGSNNVIICNTSRNVYEQSDVGLSPDGEYTGAFKKANYFARYSSGSSDVDSSKKSFSTQDQEPVQIPISQKVSSEAHEYLHQTLEDGSNNDIICNTSSSAENVESPMSHHDSADHENTLNNNMSSSCLDMNMVTSRSHPEVSSSNIGIHPFVDVNRSYEDSMDAKFGSSLKSRISIPQILHQISNNDESATVRKQALQQLIEASSTDTNSIWTKYFNQILKVVIEVLDDPDPSTSEVTLQLVTEMVNKQKDAMENNIEIVIERLLHATKATVSKVSIEAEKCLSIILSEYDPFRCLSAIVPLLISEDEKTLIICIKTLTKLVHRLSEEELLAQLPSFLPVLFDAFNNQSAEVRKTVVFCLVDIYVMLGKAFLPYLQDLNGTQLRLVTIYANRIAQARKGTSVEAINCQQMEYAN